MRYYCIVIVRFEICFNAHGKRGSRGEPTTWINGICAATMADIQDEHQAGLFFSIPIIIIVFSLTGLALLVLHARSDDGEPTLDRDYNPQHQWSCPVLPSHQRSSYRTFSDTSSSYAGDDERSIRSGRRATAPTIHSPTLPTIQDNSSASSRSNTSSSQVPFYDSPEDLNRVPNMRASEERGHTSRGTIDGVLHGSKDADIAVLGPAEEDIGSGEDVPRGRVRNRIGSGGSGEILSRWLAPRWRAQSADVEGQRSIGKRSQRRSVDTKG